MSSKINKKIPTVKLLKKKVLPYTHLYSHDQFLEEIVLPSGSLSNLTVLYLHNNYIKKIDNLDSLMNLKCLFLQKNRIEKIENLENLNSLEKLYLSSNYITVIEGLENLKNLQELHVENQQLPRGANLCFDPRTIYSLASSLQILDISSNKISTLCSLSPLKNLQELYCANNELQDLDELSACLLNWFYLKKITLAGNPITKIRDYREIVIASVYRLENLDGKTILESTRSFYKNLNKRKAKGLMRNLNLADYIEGVPKNHPIAIQNVVSSAIIRNDTLFSEDGGTIFNEEHAVYIPWKKLTTVTKITPTYRNKKICKPTVVVPNMILK